MLLFAEDVAQAKQRGKAFVPHFDANARQQQGLHSEAGRATLISGKWHTVLHSFTWDNLIAWARRVFAGSNACKTYKYLRLIVQLYKYLRLIVLLYNYRHN